MPESCSTAATIIRRPSSVCFEAPRRSFPSMATGACAVLCWRSTDRWRCPGSRRQRGEDVVEGGDCGRGVALLARAPQRTHCLELLLGEQGGELGERVHTSVAGQTGSDGDRQNGVQRVALAPVTAALGHLAQTLEQAAQPRRRHWLGVLLSVPVCRHLGPAQRLGGGVGQFEHEDLPWAGRGGASAPSLRARGQSRGSAPASASSTRGSRSRQSARHPRTSPPERTGYPCTAWMSCDSRRRLSPSTREAKLCTRPGVRMTKRELLAIRCRRPELLLRRPADPAIGVRPA